MANNDWISANLGLPGATNTDFEINGVTPENTELKDKEYYKSTGKIKEAFTNPDTGKFDDDKYSNFYNAMAFSYNDFAQNDYAKKAADNFEYSPWDPTAPKNAKIQENLFKAEKVRNPFRQKVGFEGINVISKNEFSIQELAQQNEVRDHITGESLGYTPNSSFWGKKTAVLAQYDKDGEHYDPQLGRNVKHKASDYKYDENGNFYYETLGDREPYNKQVLSWSDTLTTDGSWANKYDFMDSDGIDKSIGGVIMKTIAKAAPLFAPAMGVPYVGEIYAAGIIGLELMNVAPALIKSGAAMFIGDNDTNKEYWKNMNKIQGISKSLSASNMSDYGKSKSFGFESIGTMVGDVFSQLYSQRFIAQIPKMIGMAKVDQTSIGLVKQYFGEGIASKAIAGTLTTAERATISQSLPQVGKYLNRAVKSTKLSQGLATSYMAGTSAVGVTEAAKLMGLDERDTAAMFLGTTLGFFGMMRSIPIGEWAMKGVGMEDSSRLLNGAIKKELGKLEPVFQNIVNDAAKPGKIYALAAKVGQKIAKTFGGQIDDYASVMIAEGSEEVSEELMQDSIKGIYNGLSSLGLTSSNKKFDYGSGSDIFSRYAMSLLGGAVGGAMFHLNDRLLSGVNHNLDDATKKEIAYLAREGYGDEYIRKVEEKRKKGQLGSTVLSTEFEDTDIVGLGKQKIFKPMAEGRMSQNDAMAQVLTGVMTNVQNQIFQEGIPKNIELSRLLDERKNIIVKLDTNSPIYDDANDLSNEILKLKGEIQNASTPDPKLPAAEVEGMLKKVQSLNVLLGQKQKRLQELLSGELFPEYQKQALFYMSEKLNSPFTKLNINDYSLTHNNGKNFIDLSPEEKAETTKAFDTYRDLEGKDLLKEGYKRFTAMNDKFSPFLEKLGKYAEQRTGHYEVVDLLGNKVKYNISPDILGEIEAHRSLLNQNVLHGSFREKMARAQESSVNNYVKNMAMTDEILQLIVDPQFDRLDASLVDDLRKVVQSPYVLHAFTADTMWDTFSNLGVDEELLTDASALYEEIMSSKVHELEGVREKYLAIDGNDKTVVNTIMDSVVNSAEIQLVLQQQAQFEQGVKGRTIDTLNELIKQFEIIQNGAPSNILDILSKEYSSLEKMNEVTDYIIANADTVESLENSLAVLAQIQSLITAATDYEFRYNGMSGYNSVVNATFPDVQLGTITQNQSLALLDDIDVLQRKVNFLLELSKINNEDKIKNQKETGVVMEGLFYHNLTDKSEFGKYLSNLQIDGEDFYNTEITNAIANATTLQAVLEAKNSPKEQKKPLPSSPEEVATLELEKAAIHKAIYDRVKSLTKTDRKAVFDKLFNNGVVKGIFSEANLKAQTEFSSLSKTIEAADLFTWFNNMISVDITKFYSDLKGDDKGDGTYDGLESSLYAPFYNQEYAAKLTYGLIEDPEWSNYTVEFLGNQKTVFSQILEVYKNAIFIDGLPGSGKTSAIANTIAKMLTKRGGIFWSAASDLDRANQLTTNLGKNAALTLDKNNLLSKFISLSTLKEIQDEAASGKEGTYIKKVSLKLPNGKTDVRYKLDALKKDQFLLDESALPAVIFIDEVTHFSSFELSILNQAFSYMDNPPKLILMGDTEQNGYEHIAELDKESNNINSFTILTTPKLSASVRNSNNWKKDNLNLLFTYKREIRRLYNKVETDASYSYESVAQDMSKYSFTDLQALAFNSHVDKEGKIYGEKIVPASNATEEYLVKLLENTKGPIAFITDNKDSDLAKTIAKNPLLQTRFVVKTPAEIQGLEFEHVVIDVDWQKIISSSKQFAPKNFIDNLYTLTSRSRVGSIILDNHLTDNTMGESKFINIIGIDQKTFYPTALDPIIVENYKKERLSTLDKLVAKYPFNGQKETIVSGKQEAVTTSDAATVLATAVFDASREIQETRAEAEKRKAAGKKPRGSKKYRDTGYDNAKVLMYPFYERWGIEKDAWKGITLPKRQYYDDMEFFLRRNSKLTPDQLARARSMMKRVKTTIFYNRNFDGLEDIFGEESGLDFSSAKFVLRSSKYDNKIDRIQDDELYDPAEKLPDGVPNTRLVLELKHDDGTTIYFTLSAMADRTTVDTLTSNTTLQKSFYEMDDYFKKELVNNEVVNVYPNVQNQFDIIDLNSGVQLRPLDKKIPLKEMILNNPEAIFSSRYVLTGKAPTLSKDNPKEGEQFKKWVADSKLAGKQVVFMTYDNTLDADNLADEFVKESKSKGTHRVKLIVINEEALSPKEWFEQTWKAMAHIKVDRKPVRLMSSKAMAQRLYETMVKIAQQGDQSSQNIRYLRYILNTIAKVLDEKTSAGAAVSNFHGTMDYDFKVLTSIPGIETEAQLKKESPYDEYLNKYLYKHENLYGKITPINFTGNHAYRLLGAMHIAMNGAAPKGVKTFGDMASNSLNENFFNFLYRELTAFSEVKDGKTVQPFKEGIFTHAIFFRDPVERNPNDDYVQLVDPDSSAMTNVIPTLFNSILDLSKFTYKKGQSFEDLKKEATIKHNQEEINKLKVRIGSLMAKNPTDTELPIMLKQLERVTDFTDESLMNGFVSIIANLNNYEQPPVMMTLEEMQEAFTEQLLLDSRLSAELAKAGLNATDLEVIKFEANVKNKFDFTATISNFVIDGEYNSKTKVIKMKIDKRAPELDEIESLKMALSEHISDIDLSDKVVTQPKLREKLTEQLTLLTNAINTSPEATDALFTSGVLGELLIHMSENNMDDFEDTLSDYMKTFCKS